jgi:hypothetical protein
MSSYVPPVLGLAALALLIAALSLRIRLRAVARRARGVSVLDFGADLELPRRLHSRSYQIALYLTMKSQQREPAPTAARVNASAASR